MRIWAVSGGRKLSALQHCGNECEGQADDVEVTAFDARNPAGSAALDGVGAGFVHGLAGGDVGVDLFVRKRKETNARDLGRDFGPTPQ